MALTHDHTTLFNQVYFSKRNQIEAYRDAIEPLVTRCFSLVVHYGPLLQKQTTGVVLLCAMIFNQGYFDFPSMLFQRENYIANFIVCSRIVVTILFTIGAFWAEVGGASAPVVQSAIETYYRINEGTWEAIHATVKHVAKLLTPRQS